MALLTRVSAVGLVLWLGVFRAAAPAHAQDPLEREVRAVYLYNFARYITWPASAFPDARTPVRICVQGTDPFGDALDRAVSGETVNGRPLEAVRVAFGDPLRGCHILYASSVDDRRMAATLASTQGRPVLTVGEDDRFLGRGGMIRFRRVDNRVRFDINLKAVEANGLRISARLLGVAAEVRRLP
jgi:hypothetical protein